MAKNQKVPSNVQEQINKQVAEAKAKAEQAKANAMANGAATTREEARAAAIAKAKGTTTKDQIAEEFNNSSQNTSASSSAPVETQTTDPLATLRSVYETFNTYTPKTDEEIRAQAEGEYKSKYNLMTDAARQSTEKQDLALSQQREGLGTSYDRQRENTNRTYDSNLSAADRQALKRGMQRSSYNNQILSNIDLERARALRDIDEAQTAAEGNIDAQRAQLASQFAETERSYALAQADDIQARIRELNDQEYERSLNANQIRAQLASDLYGKEYQLGRDAVLDDQWKQQFNYQQKSDEQKIAMEYAMTIIQNGGSPSDDLLSRAGLSRADANAMKQQTENSGGGGGYYGGNTGANGPTGNTKGATTDDSVQAELDAADVPPETETPKVTKPLRTLDDFNTVVKKTTNSNARRLNANK